MYSRSCSIQLWLDCNWGLKGWFICGVQQRENESVPRYKEGVPVNSPVPSIQQHEAQVRSVQNHFWGEYLFAIQQCNCHLKNQSFFNCLELSLLCEKFEPASMFTASRLWEGDLVANPSNKLKLLVMMKLLAKERQHQRLQQQQSKNNLLAKKPKMNPTALVVVEKELEVEGGDPGVISPRLL